uniref:Uncharacterized protein n=1 Tax=Anguilla anguilla TaxID=7936 RepID=A0A0E9TSP7_ANGAN
MGDRSGITSFKVSLFEGTLIAFCM